MSDRTGGPGWWQTADGKWYPPERHPDYQPPEPTAPPALAPPTPAPPVVAGSADEELAGAEPVSSPSWRLPLIFSSLVLVLVVGALVAAIVIKSTRNSAEKDNIFGTITLHSEFGCNTADSGYSDLTEGAPVQVTNQDQKTIGVTTLDAGQAPPGSTIAVTCAYKFTVPNVPKAMIYNIQVSHRGTIGYTYEQMKAQQWTVQLTLGN